MPEEDLNILSNSTIAPQEAEEFRISSERQKHIKDMFGAVSSVFADNEKDYASLYQAYKAKEARVRELEAEKSELLAKIARLEAEKRASTQAEDVEAEPLDYGLYKVSTSLSMEMCRDQFNIEINSSKNKQDALRRLFSPAAYFMNLSQYTDGDCAEALNKQQTRYKFTGADVNKARNSI